MKINELLDATKNARGIKSDGELARMLGISKQAVSRYYLGERAPDEFACLRIAEATGMSLDTVIATVKASSEKDKTRREAWENYMKRLGGVAASFMVTAFAIVTLIVTSHDVIAKESMTYKHDLQVIQIMRDLEAGNLVFIWP
jgi:transcriptional regulator with XRE-family HTH domain